MEQNNKCSIDSEKVRPWPNDSIFLSTFQLLIFPQRVQLKTFTITYIYRPIRRYCACFHSTFSTRWPNGSIFTQQQFFCSIFLIKIKLHSASLDSTRITQQGGQTARFFARFLSSKRSSEKSSRLARALIYKSYCNFSDSVSEFSYTLYSCKKVNTL